ncbi:MAG: serine/threonine protein kinase [Gemmatimonadaceae bacterium]|nr:serine/threonine protein kinase [Gemmatimonadaceae bacterium]
MTQPKICPRCGDTYDDAVDFCAKDGTRLIRAGQSADLVGTVIAERYRIESRIGEGGMGQVYLGEHVRMRRKSAIKIMRPALVHEPEALQRFTREAENASQLSHSNIASIFDFGETADGVVYLAMEYVDGGSLADLLAREALHPEVAADIIGQAADGLHAAHEMNMLHRDIKPDNIMLGRRADGTYLVKLVDFGIARTYGSGEQKVTRTGFAVGTPQYMSPEQLAGEALDTRSDQYSLALVAFYALTGKQAFPAESTKESLILRLTSRPQSLQDARVDIEWPEALQGVFNKALSPEPGDRYATVLEFAEGLSRAISSMTPTQTAEMYRHALETRAAGVVARTPGALGSGERSIVSRSGSVPVVSGGSPVLPPPPPKARWPFVIGGVVTLSVATTLWTVNRGRSPEVPAADTMAAAPVPGDSAALASGAAPAPAPTAGTPTAGTPTAAPTVAAASAKGGKPSADTSRKAKDDTAKLNAAKRAKAAADSAAAVAAARARYPEAPLRAMIDKGIDVKAHQVRFDDMRVTVMPAPMSVWRADQVASWKNGFKRPDGSSYELADPIERWSAWSRTVQARRAVYVLEVMPDRSPWPKLDPDGVVDFKKGDVTSVELLRDGQPVSLESGAVIPAVANPEAQQGGKKPVFNGFAAVVPPTAFVPRDDGSSPRIELVVKDATRGAPSKTTLSESLVKRLYNEFAPWRDALAR